MKAKFSKLTEVTIQEFAWKNWKKARKILSEDNWSKGPQFSTPTCRTIFGSKLPSIRYRYKNQIPKMIT